MERMGASVKINDYEFDNVAFLEDYGVRVVTVDNRVVDQFFRCRKCSVERWNL